ncbi:hypothetical protein [Streptosporangium sp. G12]
MGIGERWAYKLGTGFPVSVRSSVLEGAEGHGSGFCSPMPTKSRTFAGRHGEESES